MIEREGQGKNANSTSKMESTTTTTTTTSWSRFKDPRIVRVSRAFGGKDRHSKVCTVRGLRDRRVRLSVPTAIQLYDLQDRLGLNQPSKVVDWLLNVAKQEIDGLPPLQFPILTPHPDFFIPTSQSLKQDLKNDEKGNDDHTPYVVPRTTQNPSSSSFSSLMSSSTNTTTMQAPFNSWEPPNLTLSQPSPFNLGLPGQHDQDLHNFHHFLLYQPTQPYFPSPTNAGFFDQMAKTSKENATSSILPSTNFFGGK